MYTLASVIEELEIASVYPDGMLKHDNLSTIKSVKRIPITHLRLYMLALKTIDILNHKELLNTLYDFCCTNTTSNITRLSTTIRDKFGDISNKSIDEINDISVSTFTKLSDIDKQETKDFFNVLLVIRNTFLNLRTENIL